MKFSELWLPEPHHDPEVEEDTANFLRYLLEGIGGWMDQLPLERIETGTYQLPLSISGDAVLYWRAYIYTLKGFPPRLYQPSEDKWVGLFIESVEGFQISSSELEATEFHNNYEMAVVRYTQIKETFLK